MHRAKAAICFILLALTASLACGQPMDTFAARVVRVLDGDSFVVLRDGKEAQVRLHGIDAPERSQAYSTVSRRALSNLIFGQTITVEVRDIDAYKRSVGRVIVDGQDVGLEQLRAGFAWHFTRFSTDPTYASAEREARAAGRGLWQDKDPVPPWEFRQRKRGP